MKYYVIKKDDTIDKILNKYCLTYQKFISLNGSNLKEIIKVGNKIKLGNDAFDRSYKDNINKIYQENNEEIYLENKYICPYCKNILIIPELKL